MKFSQTKPQVKNMSFYYYDLYYTVMRNRSDKEDAKDEYENNDNSFEHSLLLIFLLE